MKKTLFRLAYFSKNAMPPTFDFSREIERILEVSRRNNAHAGITGALLYNQGCFGQVLEGDYAAIERTFETIQTDERHRDAVVLQFEEVPERGFGPWSMAHVGSGAVPGRDVASIFLAADFDPSRSSGAELFQTLHDILVTGERNRRSA